MIVNEAGASVYSTSRLGREEFPDYDATLRGAISIGRRLQDPLSELVKIEPANIGVGLYQHDVKAKHLRTSLDEVVESCVNYVGVDVNTASPALLRYVSGLNQLTARRVYEHRCQHGPFRSREQLREVPGFGEATFVQAAGFLKISRRRQSPGRHLDPSGKLRGGRRGSWSKLECGAGRPDRQGQRRRRWPRAWPPVDLEALAKELDVGVLTLKDILAQLARPGRDPREDLPPPVFKQGVLKLEDLAAGHGIDRHGAQRGRFRLLCRHRHARQRPGPRQPLGRPLHPRPARGGRRGRHRQGLGAGGGQGAAAGVADDGPAGQRAAAASARRSAGGRGGARRPKARASGATGAAAATGAGRKGKRPPPGPRSKVSHAARPAAVAAPGPAAARRASPGQAAATAPAPKTADSDHRCHEGRQGADADLRRPLQFFEQKKTPGDKTEGKEGRGRRAAATPVAARMRHRRGGRDGRNGRGG